MVCPLSNKRIRWQIPLILSYTVRCHTFEPFLNTIVFCLTPSCYLFFFFFYLVFNEPFGLKQLCAYANLPRQTCELDLPDTLPLLQRDRKGRYKDHIKIWSNTHQGVSAWFHSFVKIMQSQLQKKNNIPRIYIYILPDLSLAKLD